MGLVPTGQQWAEEAEYGGGGTPKGMGATLGVEESLAVGDMG